MKPLNIDPRKLIGSDQRTPIETQKQNSANSPKVVNQELAKAVSRLTDFYGMLDVGDPKTFMAGIAAIFAQYPREVIEAAIDPASGIPAQCLTLRLADIKRICEEIYRPIERRIERERAERSHREGLALPMPPVTEESRERVAAMTDDLKQKLGPPLKKNERAKGPIAFELDGQLQDKSRPKDSDGKHALRVEQELAARRHFRDGEITP